MSSRRGWRAAVAVLALAAIGLSLGHIWRQAQAARQPEEHRNWRAATPAERDTAVTAITGQLEAFKKADFQRAVQYQSSGLKQQFKTVAVFRKMMETTYPQFLAYRKVEFGPAQCDQKADSLEIPVTLTDRKGGVVKALYLLVREDGEYHVAGVAGGGRPAPPPPARLTLPPGVTT